MKVLFSIVDIKASLPFGSASITVVPTVDTRVAIELPDGEIEKTGEEMKISTTGIKSIIRGLKIALIDEEENEF